MFTNHSNDSNRDMQQRRHRSITSSLKTFTDTCSQHNGQEVLAKIIPKRLSAIPPRMNSWKRNSTPKPFALSIFRNWDVSYSPIQDLEESHISIYQSVLSSVHSTKVSRDSVFKSACSFPVQSSEKSECSSLSDHNFESASEASDDSSVIQCKRPRDHYNDEDDEQEFKRFKFSDLHGKPVKNLFEIFAAVEHGDITV